MFQSQTCRGRRSLRPQEGSSGPCLFKAGTWVQGRALIPGDASPPRPLLAAAPSHTPPGLGADFILGSQRQGESPENKVNCLVSEKYFHLS